MARERLQDIGSRNGKANRGKKYRKHRRQTLPKATSQREYRLLAKYGISEEVYKELLMKQNGGCALCGRPPLKYSLAVDHDHETGMIRGLLCFPCNTALGTFGDSVEGLRRAIAYLKNEVI